MLIIKLTVDFTSAALESDHKNRCGSLPKSDGHSCSKYIFTGQAVSVTFRPNPSKFEILSMLLCIKSSLIMIYTNIT
jgi:hypothetical protein